jgi:hypothetical protein
MRQRRFTRAGSARKWAAQPANPYPVWLRPVSRRIAIILTKSLHALRITKGIE